ncbi:MAG: serine/threonine protein kinase, partial [Acidobacteria bacterium]|nr:serine/threonine protein kinase [Acidobacteriota bacterium]
GTFVNGLRVETAHLRQGDRLQGGETVLEIAVTVDPDSIGAPADPFTKKTEPSFITVVCLNCGIPATAEASRPDAKFSYVCDECREKLRKNPQPIPNYEMIRVLGQGGMGSVMLARSVRDGRAVAIKTLLPEVAVSEQSLKRFIREIQVSSSLEHPHVVKYIEHGTHNGIVYLVTEFVGGVDASKLAKDHGGRLEPSHVVKIMEQTLSALDFAHSKGFVHRDIKEQNILVENQFPHYIAKLADFGLSKSYQRTGMSGVTMIGDVAGTIAYMPPEQVRDFKDVRPPSDIYAAGMTAYSLLTGAHALDIGVKAGVAETVKAIFEKPIVPVSTRVPTVPTKIAAVIEKALARQPERRWTTAGEMRDALLQAS